MYTIKQLSDLAGVTVRTLHYYDEIGLLKPTEVGENRYRYYDDAALFRLQQILLYREMDLELVKIKAIIDNPHFDLVTALQNHRKGLLAEIERLKTLINTLDATILHLVGEVEMSTNKIFEGFNPEQQKKYEEEAVSLWGDTAKQSIKLWYSYSEEEKQRIMAEGKAIYSDIIANMDKGAKSSQIQSLLKRWHQHLHYFYEPTPDVLRGLGEMYCDNPDFNATFSKMHPELPAFLKKAIAYYVDKMEMR